MVFLKHYWGLLGFSYYNTKIGGRSESDWFSDPPPPSNLGGVVLADSSSESSNLMGGAIGFVFRFARGSAIGDGASRSSRGNGGAVLGTGRMSGCGGGGGPCAASKFPKTDVG